MFYILTALLMVLSWTAPVFAQDFSDNGQLASVKIDRANGHIYVVTKDTSPTQLCGGGSDNLWIMLAGSAHYQAFLTLISNAAGGTKNTTITTDDTIPTCAGGAHIIKKFSFSN